MNYTLRATLISMLLALSLTAFAGDKTVGEVIDDNLIAAKTETALMGHEATNINIEVHEGVVLLAGWVSTQAEHDKAIEITADTEGVVDVIDHLYVQDHSRMVGETIDDGLIAARVKSELASNKQTSAFDINVEVREGKVLLSGFVDSLEEAKTAMELAQGTEGVTEVIDGMEVVVS